MLIDNFKDEALKTIFRRFLNHKRNMASMSHDKLALESKVTNRTVYNYLSGHMPDKLKPGIVSALLTAVGSSMDEFIGHAEKEYEAEMKRAPSEEQTQENRQTRDNPNQTADACVHPASLTQINHNENHAGGIQFLGTVQAVTLKS